MLTALKDDGLDAKLAHDGDEAMRDVDDLSPAVMVLDLMMPKRDGFSVLRELRADGRISHLPVSVVTGIFGMSERLYATDLGAAEYVAKRFELDVLIVVDRRQARVLCCLEARRMLPREVDEQIVEVDTAEKQPDGRQDDVLDQ